MKEGRRIKGGEAAATDSRVVNYVIREFRAGFPAALEALVPLGIAEALGRDLRRIKERLRSLSEMHRLRGIPWGRTSIYVPWSNRCERLVHALSHDPSTRGSDRKNFQVDTERRPFPPQDDPYTRFLALLVESCAESLGTQREMVTARLLEVLQSGLIAGSRNSKERLRVFEYGAILVVLGILPLEPEQVPSRLPLAALMTPGYTHDPYKPYDGHLRGILGSIRELQTHGRSSESIAASSSAIETILASPNTEEQRIVRAELLYLIARGYWIQERWHDAEARARSALDETEQLEESDNRMGLLARNHNLLGNILTRERKFSEAARVLDTAREECMTLRDYQGFAINGTNRAVLSDELGEFETAFQEHGVSFKVKLEGRDFGNLAPSLTNLGALKLGFGETFEALDFFERSLGLSVLFDNPKSATHALLNIGECYVQIRWSEEAIEFLQASMDLATDVANVEERSFFRSVLALCEALSQQKKSFSAFLPTLRYVKAMSGVGYPREASWAGAFLWQHHLRMGHSSMVREQEKFLLDLSRFPTTPNRHDMRELARCSFFMAHWYEKMGHKKDARRWRRHGAGLMRNGNTDQKAVKPYGFPSEGTDKSLAG